MSDDNSGDSPSVTYGEMFKQFAEQFGDKGVIKEDTSESLQRAVEGEATEQDKEQILDSWESWLEDVMGADSSESD